MTARTKTPGRRVPAKQLKRVTLISLGCAKNLVDSEVMLGHLKKAGRYEFVQDPRLADTIIVNTCGFIQPARSEAADILGKLIRLKNIHPRKMLVVTGCYVQKDKTALQAAFPGVDVWTGVGSFDKIVEAVEGRPFREPARTFLYSHLSPRIFSTPPGWAYLKISEGCSHRCSFCNIPMIKGPYRSRSLDSIVKEARDMVGRRIKEINLISQDTTFFGKDKKIKDGLVKLLRKLLGIPGLSWIRILYGSPEEVSDGLLELFQEDRMCPYLDIPFQHADSGIIRSMKRGLDGGKALALIEKIRKKVPGIALRTSLIVGLPGEGAKEFQTLIQFVREARFNHLGVLTYSPEPGTASFSLKDSLTEEEKQRRRSELMEFQAEISLSLNREFIGRQMSVLCERAIKEKGLFIGRTKHQAPEVDGVVMLDVPDAVAPRPGTISQVEITSAEIYDLRGRLIQ